MRGVLWDLAGHGYLAVAADYRRTLRGKYRRTLFPWRDPSDVTASIEILLADRRVDVTRVWLYRPQPDPVGRFVYRMIRRHFRKESGARDEPEFQQFLREASPLQQAEWIRAPTLRIHGRDDTTVPLAESTRLADRLGEMGRDVRLLVIDGASHVFNFKDADQASEAWNATLDWLDRHLRPVSEEG